MIGLCLSKPATLFCSRNSDLCPEEGDHQKNGRGILINHQQLNSALPIVLKFLYAGDLWDWWLNHRTTDGQATSNGDASLPYEQLRLML